MASLMIKQQKRHHNPKTIEQEKALLREWNKNP
jgi:hypothetical protein